MPNENDIITELRKGNRQVFDSVYREYFRALCSYAAQYVDYDDGYEIVQSTMLWLWEKRMSLMPGMSLKSLLFTIVKNKALNNVSHKYIKMKVCRMLVEKYDRRLSDPDIYLENELFTLFSDALDKLPEKTRKIFEMNKMEGMTHSQISQRLEISRQTVNYQIRNALKILRIELKDYLLILLLILDAK